MNHTSDEHPWFQAARNDSSSIFRTYYVWSDIPPIRNFDDHPAFPETEDSLWMFDQDANSFYYHKFYHFQPDLNVSNPLVREEIHKVLDFWFSFGISGVRLDAVPVMIHKKGLESTRPSNSKEIFCQIRSVISQKKKYAVFAGEVDVNGDELIDYFADGEGLQLIFNFILNAYLIGAIVEKKSDILVQGWRELPILPESGGWLNFLRNLDELNLYQLPEDIKKNVFDKMAPETNMRIYQRGIRRRLAPMLGGDHKRISMAFSLLFSLPGTPLIVYGDEIGLGENLTLWERESIRVPMQWDDSYNGGFSKAEKNKLMRQFSEDPGYHFSHLNVFSQIKDKNSLLNELKKIIHIRSISSEIGFGKLEWVATSDPSVVCHVSHWKNALILVIHNLSERTIDAKVYFKTFFAKKIESILGEIVLNKLEDGEYHTQLTSYQYGWFRITLSKGQ